MSYHERSPLLITHDVRQQVDIGSCYLDGVQTSENCVICLRYACKAHRTDLFTWQKSDTSQCDRFITVEDYSQLHLGVACLDHSKREPKPTGFPKRQCTLFGKNLWRFNDAVYLFLDRIHCLHHVSLKVHSLFVAFLISSNRFLRLSMSSLFCSLS
jgi:hypothetical protein